MAKIPVIVHWFRRDLRIEDNRGFASALKTAGGVAVLPLFIFDRKILKRLEDQDDARVTFIHQTVDGMKDELKAAGSDLLCVLGDAVTVWRKILSGDRQLLGGLADKIQIVGVTFNKDYEPLARERDAEVEALLVKAGVEVSVFKDQVIFEEGEVVKDDGRPYAVFTPFSKKWRKVLDEAIAKGPNPLRAEVCSDHFDRLFKFKFEMPTLKDLGFKTNGAIRFPAKKTESQILKSYSLQRDLPAVRGTTRLGLHLRFGTVSIRGLVAKAIAMGAAVWLNELIWREFFIQILWHFPHVAEHAFRPEYDRIVWRTDERDFQAWCEGKTGYPLVDAGMRELNATGFMHNRVRMVAASFLVKHLLIDWRWGEAYFARRLLDFDLAANNGNWQWVAGSGCDAAPYFRVFNPELQLKRFDPKYEYVRKWVPEFGTVKQLPPMVDHAEARARVLRAYVIVKQKPE